MKLSENSLQILKNFSQFNESILIRPGNILSTIHKDINFFAVAKVEEEFPVEFAIEKLPQFLGVLSIFENPDLNFQEKMILISENKSKVRYRTAEPSMIIGAPAKKIEIPDVLFSFELKSTELTALAKSLAILSLPQFLLEGDGEDVYLKAANSRDMESNQFSVNVGKSTSEFKFFYPEQYVKIINRDYNLHMSETGLLEFRSENLSYFLMGNRS